MDLKYLKYLEDEGLITKRKHPNLNIFIYNYTPKLEHTKLWNEVTLQLRGLILDSQGNIIQRPFPKFFNIENYSQQEIDSMLQGGYKIYEKLDGSLGILYWNVNEPMIATRGSFTSEQALKGTALLHSRYKHLFSRLLKTRTYLFEIIYPENKIIVDYKQYSLLILIGVIENSTGKVLDLGESNPGFFTPLIYPQEFLPSILHGKKSSKFINKEGYVIYLNSGGMIKVKYDSYLNIAYNKTKLTEKNTCKHFLNNTFYSYYDNLPYELKKECDIISLKLTNKFFNLQSLINCEFYDLNLDLTLPRKELAEIIKPHPLAKFLFKKLSDDTEGLKQMIWKEILKKCSSK